MTHVKKPQRKLQRSEKTKLGDDNLANYPTEDPAQLTHRTWDDHQRPIVTFTPQQKEIPPSSVDEGFSKFVDVGDRRVSPKERQVAMARPTASVLPVFSIEPLTMEEICKGILTEDMLRVAAGTRQLQTVTRLELAINSVETPSVEGVWASLPLLHTLVLDGSRLRSFRDLGADLRNLHTLSIEDSGVEDLDGIVVLSRLRELRLASNKVSDVTPLACHGSLQVLDLERNRIGNIKDLEILGTIPLLYSLNLLQNPLMTSLDKLLGGQDRRVIHSLIPQLRILGKSSLSLLETNAVSDGTLRDANTLMREGVSRARAAWAEDSNISAQCTGGCPEKEETRDPNSSPVSSSPSDGVRSRHGGEGGRSSPDRGMHWDSELTQGGCPAFSGNPSSAIRRHKTRENIDTRRRQPSPPRVLDTLNLAKQIELGLRHRHNQLADRVSEWQQETCSDSFPQESLISPPHASGNSSTSTESSSQEEEVKDKYVRRGSFRQAVEGKRRGRKQRSPGGNLASPLMDTQFRREHERCDGSGASVRNSTRAGDVPLAREARPWTTGHVAGSRSAISPPWSGFPHRAYEVSSQKIGVSKIAGEGGAESLAVETNNRNERTSETGARNRNQQRHLYRRPQTVIELGTRRQSCSTKIEVSSLLDTGWQHVWESLQTGGLLCAKTGGIEVTTKSRDLSRRTETPKPSWRPGSGHFQGNVDFRNQRRTRKIIRARSAGRRRGGNTDEDISTGSESGSATGADDDDQSSVISEDADGRDEIKKKAAAFTSVASVSTDDHIAVVGCSTTGPSFSCDSPSSAHRKGSKSCREGHGHKIDSPLGMSMAGDLTTRVQRRRGEKISWRAASRRSVATMNDSSRGSSSGEKNDNCCRETAQTTKGVGSTRDENSRIGGSVGVTPGSSTGSASRRMPSTHASRMLGFDLRKSLAAIDEWTQKASLVVSTIDGEPETPRPEPARPPACFIENADEAMLKRHRGSSADAQDNGGRTGKLQNENRKMNAWDSFTTNSSKRANTVVGVTSTGSDEDSDDEEVLSVTAAREALGISKRQDRRRDTVAPATTTTTPIGYTPRSMGATRAPESVPAEQKRNTRYPSALEIDAIVELHGTGRGEHDDRQKETSRTGKDSSKGRRMVGNVGSRRRTNESSASKQWNKLEGLAMGMSDEVLEGMLRRQPRTVPELRTKDNFRYFFRGMEAGRMDRLLRKAYDGTLPPGEVDKKVEKRLGLVGDMLSW